MVRQNVIPILVDQSTKISQRAIPLIVSLILQNDSKRTINTVFIAHVLTDKLHIYTITSKCKL